jgi:hypothetical protein
MTLAGRHSCEGSSPRAEEPGDARALFAESDAGGPAGCQPLWIESLALPDEQPGELRALLEEWTEAYEPASVIESYLLEMIVYDLIRIRRCRRWQDALDTRIGPRASLHHPDRAGLETARRHYAKMFHANYSLLLELRKRPEPRSAPLDLGLALEAGLEKKGQSHVA